MIKTFLIVGGDFQIGMKIKVYFTVSIYNRYFFLKTKTNG